MPPTRIQKNNVTIVIENPSGSYKSFELDADPTSKDYPLKGVTYPVDYGYIEGYKSEDGDNLDVFVGTGDIHGYIRVSRCDVPVETKFVFGVTEGEWEQIIEAFSSVMLEKHLFKSTEECVEALAQYKK